MIIKANESFPERPVIITLYGTPGVGKTSVACTAENPILVDCDRGADRACFRADTLIASKWSDVTDQEKEFAGYKTCVLDTAKAILDDYLMVYVVEKDYKLKTNKLKAYGAIGDEFKVFTNQRRSEASDIVVIAHAKEEKDGDITKFSPDITGQSKDLILRISDQVGFVTMVNNKRVITFDPTDRTIGKNVARIEPIEIPNEKDPAYKTFMADIIAQVKAAIRKQSEQQIEDQKTIDDFQLIVSEKTTSEEFIDVFKQTKDHPKHIQAAVWKLILLHSETVGLVYDAKEKIFKAKEA